MEMISLCITTQGKQKTIEGKFVHAGYHGFISCEGHKVAIPHGDEASYHMVGCFLKSNYNINEMIERRALKSLATNLMVIKNRAIREDAIIGFVFFDTSNVLQIANAGDRVEVTHIPLNSGDDQVMLYTSKTPSVPWLIKSPLTDKKPPAITLIAAMDRNNAIGIDNDLPWVMGDDLKHFKATTLNKPILMGRATFESIGSRPLPKRRNIVISTTMDSTDHDGVEVFPSILDALEALSNEKEVMVIGGGRVYDSLIRIANTLIITRIDIVVPDADTFFPDINLLDWSIYSELYKKFNKNEKNQYDAEVLHYYRKFT